MKISLADGWLLYLFKAFLSHEYYSLQVNEYPAEYSKEQADQQKMVEEEEFEEQTEEHDGSQVTEFEEVKMASSEDVQVLGVTQGWDWFFICVLQVEHENDPEAEGEQDDVKEESEEEEEDDETPGCRRFKTERKDVTVVRLSDAASKRRNIPETLG